MSVSAETSGFACMYASFSAEKCLVDISPFVGLGSPRAKFQSGDSCHACALRVHRSVGRPEKTLRYGVDSAKRKQARTSLQASVSDKLAADRRDVKGEGPAAYSARGVALWHLPTS